ncbi:MAG: FUSC family protein [Micrococcales bacterium]
MKKPSQLKYEVKVAGGRLVESLLPIVQIVIAAVAGYSIAHYGLGHEIPMFSVTVTIASLGFTRDARPRRILTTALGMITGIVLSEILLGWFGQGLWQLASILLLTLAVARFISSNAAFAVTAGVQSMLVYLLTPPPGGQFVRSIDGLIGGAVALIVTALIPRDPRGLARSDAKKLFTVFLDSLDALKQAVRTSDVKVADFALVRVRRTQPLIDNWRMSLDSAVAIAKISPIQRKYRSDLEGQLRILRGMDLATRNLRVVVRRIDFLLRDGNPRPYLADLIEQIESATSLLQLGLSDVEKQADAQEAFIEIVHQLDPKRFGIADQLREASVLLLLRPMLIDLLCASGMDEEEARAELPAI